MKDRMKREFTDDPAAQLREYGHAISQNRWWVFFLTLALTLAAAVVITRMPNVYQATTTILVDPQQVSDQYVNPPVKEALTDRLQTISQQVLSASRLQDIIERYHLYREYQGGMSREQIIEYMRKAITIEVKHASGNGPGAFTITYEGRNPVIVAQVTNELANQFINWNLQSSEQVAETTTEFLGEQLDTAKSSLAEQEQKVRDFKMGHLGQMPEDLPGNLGTLAQLRATFQANNDSMNRLEQERIELTRLPAAAVRMGQGTEGLSDRARLEIEKAQLQDRLNSLRQHYTPTYPEVLETTARLRRVKEELKALPPETANAAGPDASPTQVRLELIAREMKRLSDEQKHLTAQIASYQAKIDAVPMREQQVTELMRDYEISKEQYRSLLAKKYSADMAGDLQRMQKGERYTILDPARPPELPVKPERALLLLLCFAGAVFLSMAFVIGKDRLDPSLKAEKQLEGMLPPSVALLAEIPTIVTASDRRRQLRFAIFALTTSVLACLIMAGVLWRIRPSL
jgi:succinoglycan biosynthesis transport protein ExoP